MACNEPAPRPYEELLAEASELPFDAEEWKQRLREAQCAEEGKELTVSITRNGREYGIRPKVPIPTFRDPMLEEKVKKATPEEQLILLRQYAVWIQHGAPNNAPRPWLAVVAGDNDCAVVSSPEPDVELLKESILLEKWTPGVLQPARLRPVKLEDGTFSPPSLWDTIGSPRALTVKVETDSLEEPIDKHPLAAADKDASPLEDVYPIFNDDLLDDILEDPRDARRRGLGDSPMELDDVSEVANRGDEDSSHVPAAHKVAASVTVSPLGSGRRCSLAGADVDVNADLDGRATMLARETGGSIGASPVRDEPRDVDMGENPGGTAQLIRFWSNIGAAREELHKSKAKVGKVKSVTSEAGETVCKERAEAQGGSRDRLQQATDSVKAYPVARAEHCQEQTKHAQTFTESPGTFERAKADRLRETEKAIQHGQEIVAHAKDNVERDKTCRKRARVHEKDSMRTSLGGALSTAQKECERIEGKLRREREEHNRVTVDLQARLVEVEALLASEKERHRVTRGDLEREREVHSQTRGNLNNERENHSLTREILQYTREDHAKRLKRMEELEELEESGHLNWM